MEKREGIDMYKIICPHCKEEIEIIIDEVIYNLNRIGKSLCKCSYCKKTFLCFDDGNNIISVRISK